MAGVSKEGDEQPSSSNNGNNNNNNNNSSNNSSSNNNNNSNNNNQSTTSWASWGKSWYNSVKEKSTHAMELVKKDLNEFVDVIQGDTSDAMSTTAANIRPGDDDDEEEGGGTSSNFESLQSATKVVRKGMANLLSSVSELMAVPPDDSNDEEITIPDLNSPQSDYDRKHELLRFLQTDPATYTMEPEGLFAEWVKDFNLDDNKQDMSSILVDNPTVRALYTQLVPGIVSHATFWQRYYYKVFLLEAEEKRREEIVARAEERPGDESSGWEEEEEEDADRGKDAAGESLLEKPEGKTELVVAPQEHIIDIGDEDEEEEEDEDEAQNLNVTLTESDFGKENERTATEIETTEHKPNEEEPENITTGDKPSSENTSSPTTEPINEPDDDLISELTSPGNEQNSTSVEDSPSKDTNETGSVGSWMSIDDEIKVKRIKGEVDARCMDSMDSFPGDVSTDSSTHDGVVINDSDLLDLDDEDFDLNVNEEDVAKMVEKVKSLSHAGAGGNIEDEDWEKWE